MRYFAALLLALAAFPATAQNAEVTGGTVQGRTSQDGRAHIYEGIPFAASPTGDNRWRAPQSVVPWTGVRSGAAPAPACLQNDYQWNRANYLFGSEDCLTLDIRTPTNSSGKLPIMVWIHGGSNRAGSGSGGAYSQITDQGVVLVTVQYRLGIFGFLSHRKLAEEQNGNSGNYGLMDQIAALKWVQSNIANFGGDPSNVTIFGESAGSQNVSLLLAAPPARGLFHKAIMQSGTPEFGMTYRPLTDAFKLGDQLDKIGDSNGDIAKLRRMSAHALLAADLELNDERTWSKEFIWLRPTIDGAVLPKNPSALLAEAPVRPVIIGTNRFEFGPAKGSIDIPAYTKYWFGENAAAATKRYQSEEKTADPRLGHLEARMETDAIFRCPANNLATQLSALGWPIWRYEFDIGPDDGSESGGLTSHAYEISFIMDRKPAGSGARAVQMQDYWTNFAKSGVPGGAGKAKWSSFTRATKAYAMFDRKGITPMSNLRAAACALVSAV